jgi:NAD(P)-dependent dehydrogenase (short-subunit alcohol dehydrogenase family)
MQQRFPGLEGAVVIVTGASRGIGAVTSRAFAAAGAKVALAARSADALEDIAEKIRSDGGDASGSPTDVGDPDAVRQLVEQTVEAFGRLDAAFNNAAGGGQPPTRIADFPVESYDSAVATTLRSVFLSMKYEIPAMLGSRGGAIVNMSSTAGLEAVGGLAGYVSAKHGAVGLTKTAALEYADQGIRVNAVAPGPILTETLERAGEDVQRKAGMVMPMQRVGRPEEVAATVLWLCSDAASYIIGTTVPIDGGKLAGMAPFAGIRKT